MAETAVAYARAAADTTTVTGLAEHADRVATGAGALDGAPLLDAEGRIDSGARALRGHGDALDGVVSLLVRAMNLALDTDEAVAAVIDGGAGPGDGLDARWSAHVAAAEREWEDWQRRVAEAGAGPQATVDIGGETCALVPGDGRPAYALPGDLPARIRARHLGRAADDATRAADDLDDLIDGYRARLAEFGTELAGLGFDLSAAGPLDLWITPGMAGYSARRLAEELARDDPDPLVIEQWTSGLEFIADSLYRDALNPADPTRRLLPAELDYLRQFLGTLDTGTLVALGEFPGWNRAKVDIANATAMLLDPGVGGLDPARGDRAVPAALRPFLRTGPGDDSEDSGLFTEETAGGRFREALARFNAVADVIGHATVPTGTRFSEDLAHAALAVHRRSSLQYATGYPGHALADTGSSDLLSAASLNGTASAGLLRDDDFRTALLAQSWEDSQGAADLIRSGTTIPPDARGTDAEAPYVAAARAVIAHATAHQDTILGQGPDALAAQGAAHHTPLQAAVADAALMRMADVAGYGDAPLPEEQRYGVFSLMARSDPTVNEAFKAGVTGIQYALAHDYYADAPGALSRTTTFETVGNLTHLVNWGEHEAIERASGDSGNALASSLTTSSIGGALWAASVPPGPQQLPLGLAAAGWSAAVPVVPHYSPQAPAAHGDFELTEGFLNEQVAAHTIARAAADARHGPDSGDPVAVGPLDTDLYARAGAVPDQRLNEAGDRLGIVGDWRTAGVTPDRYVPDHDPADRRSAP
ncbi:hypothetical protein [Streptomyces sp. RFCAC02]|uniref:hypothetical protein n=1 Tax=Streptomyces sp. RFCAC02 TaxID=2499143 RepID=UPI00101F278E|nr:hypothetical protein [Streptomyces sp. RFCAC02]